MISLLEKVVHPLEFLGSTTIHMIAEFYHIQIQKDKQSQAYHLQFASLIVIKFL